MITLDDAIERARLASDESGILSHYTYNQIIDQLAEHETYAFTMALVDLGIQTKYGSKDKHSDIIEEFQKAAQSFKQSPGGIWMPDTGEDTEQALEAPESTPTVQEEEPFYGWDAGTPNESPQNSNTDLYDLERYVEILANEGIHVSADGMVSFYKSNIPGVFSDQIPMKPIPMDKSLKMLEQKSNMNENEQGRVKSLQDVLSGLNNEFLGLEDNVQDMVANFDDVLGLLEQFKYSEKSPNQDVANIAEGLTTIRNYLEETGPELEDLQYGIGEHSGVIGDMQGQLDVYFQGYYDQSGGKNDLVEAMKVLQYIQEEDPEAFASAVQNMGGLNSVAAMFYEKSPKQTKEAQEDEDWEEQELKRLLGDDYFDPNNKLNDPSDITTMSLEQFIDNPVEGFRYILNLHEEANANDPSGIIEIGPKFFDLNTPEQRSWVISHEKAHHAFDANDWVNSEVWWTAVNSGVFGTFNEEQMTFEGIHGRSPMESTVEGMVYYQEEPEWLRSNWPLAYQFLSQNMGGLNSVAAMFYEARLTS